MLELITAAGPAVGSIVGGVLAKKAQDKATQANKDIAGFNAETQEQFAKEGVRWKVADAKAAGIHPLAALGAPTASFTPTQIGATPNFAMADMAKDLGQDLSRAAQAGTTTPERRLMEIQIQGAKLDLQGKELDNQIKIDQLRRSQSTGPAMPGSDSFISGQGAGTAAGRRVMEKPLERTMSLRGSPHAEPGAVSDVGWAKTSTGLQPIPSGDIKQRIEDSMPHEWSHYIRNNIAPIFGGTGSKPPKSALPKGYSDWEWSLSSMEWQPVRGPARSILEKFRSNATSPSSRKRSYMFD